MAGNVTGLNVFQNAVSPEPLVKLDQNFNALQTSINTLNTYSNFLVDTGTPNNLNVTAAGTQYVSYSDGLQVLVRIGNTNTGPSTLNINNMGPKPIIFPNGSALGPNALVAGSIQSFVYNASLNAFQLIGISGGALTVSAPLGVIGPNGEPLFNVNTPVAGSGECLVVIGPGDVGAIQSGPVLCLNGMTNYPVLKAWGARHSTPDNWIAEFHAGGYYAGAPPTWTPITPGTSFGMLVQGGTDASDTALLVESDGYEVSPGVVGSTEFFILRGDGSGRLGNAPNQIIWDPAGHFSLTGTATLPWPAIDNLPDITITNPVQGDVLSWDATTQKWVNAPSITALTALTDVTVTSPANGQSLVYDSATQKWVNGAAQNALAALNDVALATPASGQSLIYNAVTQKWVNTTPVTVLPQLSDVHLAGPVSGQVLTYSATPTPGWVNATIPGYNFLNTVSVGTPTTGQVLTWDGAGWVAANPGQVTDIPLTGLTDVNIQNPLNRQVLTWDAPNAHWINAPAATPYLATLPDVTLTGQTQGQVLAWNASLNRWVNSSLPGGSVIALDTLMDTNISDPQNNQVLTWDYASERWVNRSPVTNLSALSDVTLTSPVNGQVLSYTGTHWVNTTPVSVTVAATAPANPQPGWLWWDAVGGQLYVWFASQWVVANPGNTPSYALSQLTDVTLSTPAAGQLLTYDGSHWVNSRTITGVANGNALTVNGASNSSANAWVAQFIAQASNSYNNGVLIQAGGQGVGGVTDTPFRVVSAAAATNYFILHGDGTGQLGVAAGVGQAQQPMLWNLTGDFSIGQPSLLPSGGSTSRLFILGRGQNKTLVCQASGGQDWIAQFLTGTTGSPSYGVAIVAGVGSADYVLSCQPAAGGNSFLDVMGDGSIWMRRILAGTGTTVVATPAGEIRYQSSAARFKREIHSVRRSRARETIAKLRTISYHSTCKGDDPSLTHYGLIAEEVAAVDQNLVGYDQEGKLLSVHYDRIAMLLLPLMQELLGLDEPEGAY